MRQPKKSLLDYLLSINDEPMRYKEDVLPPGNYMISCDYHAPYFSEVWVNRLLKTAHKFKIKKNIIIGDLFDMNFAKHWYSDEPSSLDAELKQNKPLMKALGYFDENYLVQGNHESRIGRLTDAKIQARHLFILMGGETWQKKFKYSEYDKVGMGNKWLLVHPKSYSQVSPQVARRLAEKYHKNIINSHGHLVGSGYDRSGKYLTVDLGGMFDTQKVEYINKHTTTHPVWGNGFGMMLNGKFWHFTDQTDWKYWGLA